MRTKKLLTVGVVAVAMLAIPTAGVANPAAVGAPPTLPTGLASVITPLSACGTHLRWVPARGVEGGHYAGNCGNQLRWVPARGVEGGHYESSASRCLHWVQPRGIEGGHYEGVCGRQPVWVPGRGVGDGHYAYAADGSGILSSPQPIATHATASEAPSSSFDWGSASIGAATAVGALAIALAAIAGLRRRHDRAPDALTTR